MDRPLLPLRSFVVAAALLLACSCAGVKTESAEGFSLGSIQTYAWRTEPSLVADEFTSEDEVALESVRTAVAVELEALGLTEAEQRGEADALVVVRLQVTEQLQNNDRFFSLWVAEKWEEGTVLLELQEPASRRMLWRGEVRARIRYTARTMTSTPPRWTPTGEKRRWETNRMVRRLSSELADA